MNRPLAHLLLASSLAGIIFATGVSGATASIPMRAHTAWGSAASASASPTSTHHLADWYRSYGKCSQYGYSSTGGSLPFGPHLWVKVCAPDIASKLFGKVCDVGVSAVGLGGAAAFVAGKLCGLAGDWAAGHVLSHHGVWAEIYTRQVLAFKCNFPTILASHDCSWNSGVW